MSGLGTRGVRRGFAVLGTGMFLCAAPAWAAQPNGAPGQGAPASDPLSRNLHELAENPRSLSALSGAGKAALDAGDAQGALTFFARAEDVAPRDGRVKMWIGATLVQLEQPRAAMKFFKDATDLGLSEAEVARERGLAWDLVGEPRRAQRDYRLALGRGPDPEVSRRLALSLAISGDREAALRLLDDPAISDDRATARTRALVLALVGDTAGAGRAVQASMPGPAGEAMMPFLARLPQLSYTDRALAVHLGHFPGDGRVLSQPVYAANRYTPPASRPEPTDAGRPDEGMPSLARMVAAAPRQDEAPRRRPGEVQVASAAPVNAAQRPAPAPGRRSAGPSIAEWSWSRGNYDPPRRQAATPKPATTAALHTAPPAKALHQPVERPVEVARADPPPSAPAEETRHQPEPEVAPPVPAQSWSLAPAVSKPPREAAPRRASETRESSRLADLAATIDALPDPVRGASSRASAERKPDKRQAPKPKVEPQPSRAWVQIAVASERSALPQEFARLKAKAPKLFANHAAWTAPMGNTNRLLVGPFETPKEAQAFVHDLAKADLGAFAWTSDEGEKVQKLVGK
jgi:Flp pilus assembly protein TadD